MLSIILLSYQSEKRIDKFFGALNKKMLEENIQFECIIMDDASTDASHTFALELENKYENVRAFQLSRNFTSHYSIFAGFTKVRGSCAVALPDDFQVPLETVVEMYRLWEKGKKVIIPFRKDRADSFISNFFSNLYYSIMNTLSEVKFPKGGADIFLALKSLPGSA